MKLALLAVALSLAARAAGANVRGVAPDKQYLYAPGANGQWACLGHPDIKLDLAKINDDYCDCPDGSDEPGTAACARGRFFCENAGFQSSYIPSFKVNDGVCDYEICCDGSDEWNTGAHCPNRCAELSHQLQARTKEHRARLSLGLKIKSKLLEKARKYEADLNATIQRESQQASDLNSQVYELKTRLDDLNLKHNRDAVLFLQDLTSPAHNATLLEQQLHHYTDAIKLIRLGVDENNGKIAYLQDLLGTLSSDFDQSINDVAVKEAIEKYRAYEQDGKYKEAPDLYDAYDKQYRAYLRDLKLYTLNLFLEHNSPHLENWKNFFWTRKSSLHAALLKVLLLQDDQTKRLEPLVEEIEKNYNPNFNNDVVKTALRKIEGYNELKKRVQDEVLGKIDYVKDYDQAAKTIMNDFEKLERDLGRMPAPLKELSINDDTTEEELAKLREEKQIQGEKEETEQNDGKSLFQSLHEKYAKAVEDFLGVNDNVPEKVDPVFESVAYDIVLNKLDAINDLSGGSGDASSSSGQELRVIADEIAAKQEEISFLNKHVAELVEELNTSRYGPDKILKALEDETFKASIGEYEYEINFLGDIRQVGNGQNVLVGRYSGETTELSTPAAKKLELFFNNGAKCWSGPIREAKVTVQCGAKVEILKVTEPEVCQYFIDITAPIACFESDLEKVENGDKRVEHDEL